MRETPGAPLEEGNAANTGTRASGIRRRLVWLCVIGVAGFLLYRVVRENWHTVVAGSVYRSGQLSPEALQARISVNGLRTVINLRGPNPDLQWYRDERAAADAAGVAHRDFRANSNFAPTKDELRELVNLLDRAARPILMHCESGIDRSGPAAAVSVLLLDPSGSPEEALDELSLLRGHLPWRASTGRHRAFIELYQSWLTSENASHSAAQFRHWALHVYERPLELSEAGVAQAAR